MQVDREVLLAATKAASLIVDPNHSIPIFSKVWLLEDTVLGFNANGMVIKVPCKLPNIGGIEGKLLVQLLEKMDVEELTVSTDSESNLIIDNQDYTVIKLPVLEESNAITEITQLPKLENKQVVSFSIADLFEEVELAALLQFQTIPNETMPDFSSVVFAIDPQKSEALLYTSDRISINRTKLSVEINGGDMRRLIPIEFMRTLFKLRETFIEGTFSFDENVAIIQTEDAQFFCRLPKSEGRPNFESAVRQIWPNGKLKPKLMVTIPEELKDILTQVKLICKDDNDAVKLTVSNGELTLITSRSERGRSFTATIQFDHPPANITASCTRLLQALPHATKMILLDRAVAFRGPNQFWRFISGKA